MAVMINIATTTLEKTTRPHAPGAIYPLQTERVGFIRGVLEF